MRKLVMIGALAAVVGAAATTTGAVSAAEVEVKMLNRGAAGMMVFEPAFVKVAPGDTVRFVAVDKGHNVESIDGMQPDGAQPFVGKFNADLSITFEKPGVYGYKCKPHYGMGMVGLVAVGDPVNADAAKAVRQSGKAKKVFAGLFEKLASTETAAK